MPVYSTFAQVVLFTVIQSGDTIDARASSHPVYRLVEYYGDDDDRGTAEEWERLDREALSSQEIDELAQYLLSTGQASI